jgi:hypothetical protein
MKGGETMDKRLMIKTLILNAYRDITKSLRLPKPPELRFGVKSISAPGTRTLAEYDPKTNVITIYIVDVIVSKYPIVEILLHEIRHYMQAHPVMVPDEIFDDNLFHFVDMAVRASLEDKKLPLEVFEEDASEFAKRNESQFSDWSERVGRLVEDIHRMYNK